ncbi:MAG: tRNA (adenosine(37)-N6)-threonylcarbamoyltransferase complex ATPase subunit type 1 TsaE [Anaerolineae bacterium]|nr:tRNA (adenosine(37)-N6)-threonylcarbamoyltransferase complex ATPase subunit type 1 TsaE [Anaerolineae bacterium]MCO5199933.1 tRNA (adenosine(37)-N6)-threonylcarbamoyltransferase complex ATPase subunit type 1 TsaE [Anaerolineae bacterium]
MAILSNKAIDFTSNSVEQTERLGIRLGELLALQDIVCLSGDLGAGKTVLARGIGRGWGTTMRVTSPTFTLINEYPRARDGGILYHVDCYRLHNSADIITTGIEDILDAPGAMMIEWPEILEPFLPVDYLLIGLRYVSETRRGLRITGGGERSLQLLTEFRRSAFGR